MANTFELIASVTVGSGGTANINFSSIPATFTDLCLLVSARTNYADRRDILYVNLNNSTADFTFVQLVGNGLSATGSVGALQNGPYASGNTATASTFGNGLVYIPNYAVSKYKSVSVESVNESNHTNIGAMGFAGMQWAQNTAINRITLVSYVAATIQEYSTAYLYGIKKS
jgi:hypothetical protein